MVYLSLLSTPLSPVNTIKPWKIDRHFADDIFKSIFLNENVYFDYGKFQRNPNQNTNISMQGNEFENVVCEMVAILLRLNVLKSFIWSWFS